MLANSFSLWGSSRPQYAKQEEGLSSKAKVSSLDSFVEAVESNKKHSLDPFQLLRQSVIPSTKSIQGLELVLLDSDYNEIEKLQLGSGLKASMNQSHLLLRSKHGFHHYFHMEVSSLVYIGEKIFWVERDYSKNRFLYWIDLKDNSFGSTEQPVFKIPLKSKKIPALNTRDGDVFLNDKLINQSVLRDIAAAQSQALNMMLNLVYPTKDYSSEWISSFMKSFIGPLSKSNKAFPRDMGLGNLESIEFNLLKQSHNRFEDSVTKEELSRITNKFSRVEAKRKDSQLLLSKFNAISFLYLQKSKKRARKIKDALLALYTNKKIANENLSDIEIVEVFTQLSRNKLLHLSVLGLGSLSAYALFPAEFVDYSHRSIESVSYVVEKVFGGFNNLLVLSVESIRATFSGFDYKVFGEAYLFDGRSSKTALGLAAVLITGVMAIFIPHLLVNTYKLSRELGRDSNKEDSYRLRFISRQKNLEKRYIELLADDSPKETKTTSSKFFEMERSLVNSYIADAKQKDFPHSRLYSFWQNLKLKLGAELGNKTYVFEKNIKSFSDALMHFLFSMASFTESGSFFVHYWNSWYVIRALLLKPRLFPYLLTYPRYFNTAVRTREKGVHFPNHLNGGSVNAVKMLHERFFSESTWLEAKKQREIVLNIEQALELKILAKANAFHLRFKNEYSINDKSVTSPVAHLLDRKFKELSYKNRMFFYWFYKKSMSSLIPKLLEFSLSNSSKKNTDISSIEAAKLLVEDYFNRNNEAKIFESIYLLASNGAQKSFLSFQNYLANFELKALASLSPENSLSFERYAVTLDQLKKPKALARAVRSTLANVIIDRPIELLFLLFMVAGVSGDLIKPVHDEMFGPNSWFYLSKYQFLSGFLHGMIAGFLYRTWMKLQYDARLEHSGVFEAVPKSGRSRDSFWSYYRENLNTSDNTWWKNQWYITKLAWANLGVATLSYSSAQYFYLGRVDLDLYFAGYIMFFLSPFSGIAGKLENAFEKSTGWVLRDIPAAYRNRPEVIKYANYAKSRLRFKYNFFYSIYENSVEHFLSNMKSMQSEVFGTRGFSRMILGGYTFTEAALLGLDRLEEKLPLLEKPINSCKTIFSKNFTAFSKK